jgi:hypothetical protein
MKLPVRTAACAALLVMAGSTAAAQTVPVAGPRPTPPYRGLFGPDERDAGHPPVVALNAMIYVGADDSASLSGEPILDEAIQSGQLHQGVQLSLALLRQRPRAQVGLQLASAVRYYGQLQRIGTQKHTGQITTQFQTGPNTTLRLAQSAAYSPSYHLQLGLPLESDVADLAADVNHSVARERQMTYGTTAALTHAASPARDLTLGYTRQDSIFFAGDDFHSQRASFQMSHRLSSVLHLRTGYGLAHYELNGAPAVFQHEIDLGIGFNQAFALSPRTRFTVSTGSALLTFDGERTFQLTGRASLRRRLSPRWDADLSLERGIQAIDRLPRPFAVTTLAGELTGYLNRRTRLRVAPAASRGADVAHAGRRYTSETAASRVDLALSRHWAVYVEHFYYRYAFTPAADLPAFLDSGMNRHGLRWGLALWAPLVR